MIAAHMVRHIAGQGFTPGQMGEELNVNPSAISAWRRGTRLKHNNLQSLRTLYDRIRTAPEGSAVYCGNAKRFLLPASALAMTATTAIETLNSLGYSNADCATYLGVTEPCVRVWARGASIPKDHNMYSLRKLCWDMSDRPTGGGQAMFPILSAKGNDGNDVTDKHRRQSGGIPGGRREPVRGTEAIRIIERLKGGGVSFTLMGKTVDVSRSRIARWRNGAESPSNFNLSRLRSMARQYEHLRAEDAGYNDNGAAAEYVHQPSQEESTPPSATASHTLPMVSVIDVGAVRQQLCNPVLSRDELKDIAFGLCKVIEEG